MKSIIRLLRIGALASCFLWTIEAYALGLFEVGGNVNYRKSFVTPETYDESLSYTGSLSYYFMSQSAIELNYTDGESNRFMPASTYNIETLYKFSMVGADLVLVFADRTAAFVPYIKMGGAYFTKKNLTTRFRDKATGSVFDTSTEEQKPMWVPSAGLGLKIGLTQSMSLKVGLDFWSSRPLSEKPVRIDTSARVGLSWFL